MLVVSAVDTWESGITMKHGNNKGSNKGRRYVGEKLYMAEIAKRKASLLADNGTEPSAPFWTEATCACGKCDICQASEDPTLAWYQSDLDYEDQWYTDMMRDHAEHNLIMGAV